SLAGEPWLRPRRESRQRDPARERRVVGCACRFESGRHRAAAERRAHSLLRGCPVRARYRAERGLRRDRLATRRKAPIRQARLAAGMAKDGYFLAAVDARVPTQHGIIWPRSPGGGEESLRAIGQTAGLSAE